MTDSGLRLRRVRFKSGGSLEMLPSKSGGDRAWVQRRINIALDQHGDDNLAGFGFVVWGFDNASTAVQGVAPGSPVSTVVAPDFVRNRLLLETAERWSVNTVLDIMGYGPLDEPA